MAVNNHPLLEFLWEQATLIVLEVDSERIIRDVNRYGRELLGDEIIAQPLDRIFVDFGAGCCSDDLFEQSGEPHRFNIETCGGLPQTLYFYSLAGASCDYVVGQVNEGENESLRRSLVLANNELSNLSRELHRGNAELRRLNDLKNQFLGMAAHDLRNPLGAIMHYSEFLLEDLVDPAPEHCELLDDIHSLSEFLLSLINDLLDISVIESGQLQLKKEEVDLARLIENAVSLQQVFAGRKNSLLRFTAVAPPPLVDADPVKLKQVLNNLLSNAVKFSPSNSTIRVCLTCDEKEARVDVQDPGPGIAPEEMTRLFHPFAGISTRATHGEGSTGLGLAISQKIIVAHGGRIWAQSEQGTGTTFSFSIPLQGETSESVAGRTVR